MPVTCTRRIQFCAGHRVAGHENKCAHLHGHNYVALVTAEAEELDDVGRVIDFSVLKDRVGGWINEHWDHGFILWTGDTVAHAAISTFNAGAADQLGGAGQKLFKLPFNPTAENMARYLIGTVCPDVLGGTGVTVTSVRVWETENCYAEATL